MQRLLLIQGRTTGGASYQPVPAALGPATATTRHRRVGPATRYNSVVTGVSQETVSVTEYYRIRFWGLKDESARLEHQDGVALDGHHLQ